MPGPGLLLVLSAPSGAGKTTLARRFLAREPDARFSVSATTRPPRGGERDGVDYHFLTPERFAALVALGAFAEWAEVYGHRYGTLRSTLSEALEAGRVAIFDIDVQGGLRILAGWRPQAAAVFVLPPTMQELERRLRARSTEPEETIQRRLAAAREEIARGAERYDYLLVNDRLDEAVQQLEALVRAERARLSGRPDPAAAAAADLLRRGHFDVGPWLAVDGKR